MENTCCENHRNDTLSNICENKYFVVMYSAAHYYLNCVDNIVTDCNVDPSIDPDIDPTVLYAKTQLAAAECGKSL